MSNVADLQLAVLLAEGVLSIHAALQLALDELDGALLRLHQARPLPQLLLHAVQLRTHAQQRLPRLHKPH